MEKRRGSYSVPQRVGQFELSLKVGSQHIKSSPYQFFEGICKSSVATMLAGSCTLIWSIVVNTNGDVYASSANGYIHNNSTAICKIGSKGNSNAQFSSCPHSFSR